MREVCDACGSEEFVTGPWGRRCAWLFTHGLWYPPPPSAREVCDAVGDGVICQRFAHGPDVKHRALMLDVSW